MSERGADNGRDRSTELSAASEASEASEVDDAVARLLADSRVEDRVTQRRRTRWLTRQAAESTTFASLLDNLAEIGQPITLRGRTGTVYLGSVRVLGQDVMALSSADAMVQLIALSHVVSLEHAAGTRPSALTGDRPTPRDRPTMRQLLAELADDEPEATFTLDGGGSLQGRLRWVGEDVAAISPPTPLSGSVAGGDVGWTYVRLSSLSVVSVRLSALSVSG